MSDEKTAAIIGGGLAGMAAAAALQGRGLRVELFEAKRRLGGRAGSFHDEPTGERIDHCQHVGMGCCVNLLDFCRRLGIDSLLRRQRELYFFSPEGRRCEVRSCDLLPPPLHLAPSLLRMSYLSLSERLSLGTALLRLARVRPESKEARLTMSVWLEGMKQSRRSQDRFWSIVLVSALAETLDRVSVLAARKVFVDGFLAHVTASDVYTPDVSLDALYDQAAAQALEHGGTTIHRETRVRRILGDAGGVREIELASGERRQADYCIVAVPWKLAPRLLCDELAAAVPEIVNADGLQSSPITAAHLWFDRPLTSLPHAVMVDCLSQWLFTAREGNPNERAAEHGHYCQVVISASRQLADRPRDEIIAEVLRDLASVFPAAREAKLLRHRLVTEHDSVFSVTPESDSLRPPQQTSVANLFAAGDWTRTGWPATMEGSVRSGYLAAEALLRQRGEKAQFLVPDLPRGLLARWLL